MNCSRPVFIRAQGTVGCGQCDACRINRKRAWAARILLEMIPADDTLPKPSMFVTLTYDETNVPKIAHPLADGSFEFVETLDPRDLTLFLKRFRKAIAPRPIRFFAVGEYGDVTFRPHYHLCMFNVTPDDEAELLNTWGMGHIQVDEMNAARAAYCANYTTKKMTGKDDDRLRGRIPEFARMSRNPAIGTPGVDYLVNLHMSQDGSKVLSDTGDIIRELRFEGRRYPIAYTIAQKVREQLGVPLKACERPKREDLIEMSMEDVMHAREKEKQMRARARLHASL